jgi:hypothetical protein
MKRDVLFEMTKRVAIAQDKLISLDSVLRVAQTFPVEHDLQRLEKRADAAAKWGEAAEGLDQAAFLVDLSCGEEVRKALQTLGILMRITADKILDGVPNALSNSLSQLIEHMRAVRVAMRKEIGMDAA